MSSPRMGNFFSIKTQCPQCKRNGDLMLEHRTSSYTIGGTPYPEDLYFAYCELCGEETEIMPLEYYQLTKSNKAIQPTT